MWTPTRMAMSLSQYNKLLRHALLLLKDDADASILLPLASASSSRSRIVACVSVSRSLLLVSAGAFLCWLVMMLWPHTLPAGETVLTVRRQFSSALPSSPSELPLCPPADWLHNSSHCPRHLNCSDSQHNWPAALPASSGRYGGQVVPTHTFLISFPRSGNTMLRKLLEDNTGVLTGSVYSDVRLFRAGLRGEMQRTDVLLLKHHFFHMRDRRVTLDNTVHANASHGQYAVERFLYIVRNPIDALVSYFQFELLDRHEATLRLQLPALLPYLSKHLPLWAQHVHFFTSDFLLTHCSACDSLAVRYEDVVSDQLRPESDRRLMTRLLTFLDFPAHRNCRLRAAGGEEGVVYKLKARSGLLNSTQALQRNSSYADELFAAINCTTLQAFDRMAGVEMKAFGYWPLAASLRCQREEDEGRRAAGPAQH